MFKSENDAKVNAIITETKPITIPLTRAATRNELYVVADITSPATKIGIYAITDKKKSLLFIEEDVPFMVKSNEESAVGWTVFLPLCDSVSVELISGPECEVSVRLDDR